MSDRDKVDEALSRLRASGVVALGPIACCQTCGRYEIEQMIKGMGGDPDEATFVFWHDQSDEGAFSTKSGKRGNRLTGDLYLYWQGDKAKIAEGLLQSGFIVDVPESDAKAFVLWKAGTR